MMKMVICSSEPVVDSHQATYARRQNSAVFTIGKMLGVLSSRIRIGEILA
jgi:hypothetical protein